MGSAPSPRPSKSAFDVDRIILDKKSFKNILAYNIYGYKSHDGIRYLESSKWYNEV